MRWVWKFGVGFVLVALVLAGGADAATYFVKQDGSGSADGTDWSKAWNVTQLVSFLTSKSDTTAVDIHVASGDYQLSSTTTETFNLKKGVMLYGGYDPLSTGVSTASRDIAAYKTILNGGGVSRSVAVVTGGNGALTTDTHIDGFTITGGINSGNGGGMFNSSSSPTITDCTFSGNVTTGNNNGGGMYNSSSSPTITNCTFSGNSANNNNGGGMYNSSSSPTITNCTFSGNTANNWGGGILNSSSSPTITNCTFSGNVANTGQTGSSGGGGGMYNISSPVVLANTIFWGNTGGIGIEIYHYSNTTTLKNCEGVAKRMLLTKHGDILPFSIYMKPCK